MVAELEAFRQLDADQGAGALVHPLSHTQPRSSSNSVLYCPAMSKVCHVCAKGPSFGHNRSHSMVATKRRFDPNLQRVRIDDGGTPRRVYVCTRCLKAGKVTKAR